MTTILEKTAGLVAFVRTVEAGSFSTAGRLVGATPSAVSKSVARLEKRLGVRLIQRSTRTLGLTTEGMAYYERVAPLLRAMEDAEDVVQVAEDARGLLRITAPVDLGRTPISAWTQSFVTRNPKVKLELSVTDRHVDLIREGYDIAIRIGNMANTELIGRKLANLQFVLVASPHYLKTRGVPLTPADLNNHACLRYLLGGRPYPITFADGSSMNPHGSLDADDGRAFRSAAVNHAGIAYLARFNVAEDLDSGRLVPVLPDVALPTMPVHAVHAFGRQLPVRARLYIDFLVEQMGDSVR